MVEIKAASYTYTEGLVMGIPAATWLAWYLPSTVVLYPIDQVAIMIHISMKVFTTIIKSKREVRKCNSILARLATMWQRIQLYLLYIYSMYLSSYLLFSISTLFSASSSIDLKLKLAFQLAPSNLPSLLYFSPFLIKMNKLTGLLVST